jgi:hypothetical protein
MNSASFRLSDECSLLFYGNLGLLLVARVAILGIWYCELQSHSVVGNMTEFPSMGSAQEITRGKGL